MHFIDIYSRKKIDKEISTPSAILFESPVTFIFGGKEVQRLDCCSAKFHILAGFQSTHLVFAKATAIPRKLYFV